MIDAALIADGGQLSVMRPLAAYAFGAWTVTWPDDFDAPTLDDDRRLGFVADLPERRRPGRLARRFTRVDAEINAVDGGSNVEEILDEAAQRTAGREFFEREIGPAGFGRLVPGVDVRVNDRKPVLLWRRLLPDQLVTELRFDGAGTATAQVGGQPVSDDLRRLAANRENDQKILAERRDADEAVRSVARASARAISVETRNREADMASIRDLLGGPSASDASLLSQLAAVNAQIINMGEKAPPPGLLNSYMSLNTLLWEQQKEINRLREEFEVRQSKVDAEQDRQRNNLSRLVHLNNHGAWRPRAESRLGTPGLEQMYQPVGCEVVEYDGDDAVRVLDEGWWQIIAQVTLPKSRLAAGEGNTTVWIDQYNAAKDSPVKSAQGTAPLSSNFETTVTAITSMYLTPNSRIKFQIFVGFVGGLGDGNNYKTWDTRCSHLSQFSMRQLSSVV